jgi:hypothetical protein
VYFDCHRCDTTKFRVYYAKYYTFFRIQMCHIKGGRTVVTTTLTYQVFYSLALLCNVHAPSLSVSDTFTAPHASHDSRRRVLVCRIHNFMRMLDILTPSFPMRFFTSPFKRLAGQFIYPFYHPLQLKLDQGLGDFVAPSQLLPLFSGFDRLQTCCL